MDLFFSWLVHGISNLLLQRGGGLLLVLWAFFCIWEHWQLSSKTWGPAGCLAPEEGRMCV